MAHYGTGKDAGSHPLGCHDPHRRESQGSGLPPAPRCWAPTPTPCGPNLAAHTTLGPRLSPPAVHNTRNQPLDTASPDQLHRPARVHPQPHPTPPRLPPGLPQVGLLGPDGKDMPLRMGGKDLGTTTVLKADAATNTFVFEGVEAEPVPSLLRDFSAPVKMVVEGQTDEQLVFLFANDSDEFNRWGLWGSFSCVCVCVCGTAGVRCAVCVCAAATGGSPALSAFALCIARPLHRCTG